MVPKVYPSLGPDAEKAIGQGRDMRYKLMSCRVVSFNAIADVNGRWPDL